MWNQFRGTINPALSAVAGACVFRCPTFKCLHAQLVVAVLDRFSSILHKFYTQNPFQSTRDPNTPFLLLQVLAYHRVKQNLHISKNTVNEQQSWDVDK
jgi:hypothetical protein